MSDFNSFTLENLTVSGDEDGVVRVVLSRPQKRNALNAETIEELIEVFSKLPRMGARAVVLAAEGDHFCAGLDLVEHHNENRRPEDFMHICLRWHEAFNKMDAFGSARLQSMKGLI